MLYIPNSITKVDSTTQITNVCSVYPMMLHSNTRQQQTAEEKMKILSYKTKV